MKRFVSLLFIVLLDFFDYNMDIDMSECKGVILLPEKGNELEQARKYGNKIRITDIAIKKVRYIEYKDLTDAQNAVMQRLAKEVLFLSQTYNDSNEVAITCDLALSDPLENYGISILVVVSNQGKVHYLYKDKKYSEKETIQLFNECVDGLDCSSTVNDRYHRALAFLARCSETGLFYS